MEKKKRNSVLSFEPFREIVQLALTPEISDMIVEYVADVDSALLLLFEYADQGCSVSLKPKPEGGFAASIQILSRTNVNAGLMLFGNGPTRGEAACVLLAKINFLGLESDWTSKVSSTTAQKWR